MKRRLRRFVRILAADLLHYSGALRLLRLFRKLSGRAEICVLCLHRVLTQEQQSRSNSHDSMVLSDTAFVKLLQYIKQHFHVISLDSFLGKEGAGINQAKPYCLLTFDDGWNDNYTTACPWLKKFGIPATVFLATGVIGGDEVFWVERLRQDYQLTSRLEVMKNAFGIDPNLTSKKMDVDELIEYLKHMPAHERRQWLDQLLPYNFPHRNSLGDRMLTWDEIREMSRGGIEFGGHTVNHPLLPYEKDSVIEDELRGCKQQIETKLGKRVRALAYPNGDWNERVRRRVEEAGFECAFTTKPAWYRRGEDIYTVPRILLHEGNVTGRGGEFSAAVFNFTLTGWR